MLDHNSNKLYIVVSSSHFAICHRFRSHFVMQQKVRHEDDPVSLSSTPQASQKRLRSRSTTSTAKATTELGLELARSATLALLAGVTSSVAITVTATAATATTTPLTVVTTEHASGRSVRALLLDVCLGHNLGREVEPFTEVVETLGGQGVVVPLP